MDFLAELNFNTQDFISTPDDYAGIVASVQGRLMVADTTFCRVEIKFRPDEMGVTRQPETVDISFDSSIAFLQACDLAGCIVSEKYTRFTIIL